MYVHAAVEKHRGIIPALLAGHALSGFGVGKGKKLKVLNS
jgi:hypothetical protein